MKWRLTDRTRTLLTLELAIVLPAAALMGFSIWNLKHIQRSEAVEAALQRDFAHVLKIAEMKTWDAANEVISPVRKEFPNPDQSRSEIQAALRRILTEHPEFSYAIFYDKKNHLFLSQEQPRLESDAAFCARTQESIGMVANWLPVEAPGMAERVHVMAVGCFRTISMCTGIWLTSFLAKFRRTASLSGCLPSITITSAILFCP
jgi:hypothetical protein